MIGPSGDLVPGPPALAVLWLLSAAAPAAPQDVTGVLTGRVVAPWGAPLAAASVAALPHARQTEWRLATGDDGRFRFPALPPGLYDVVAERPGHVRIRLVAVQVRLGGETDLGDLAMALMPVELDSVVVQLARERPDPSATLSYVLRAETYSLLPIGRDYSSIVELLPHANESYQADGVNVAGSTGLENLFFVDGLNVTNPVTGERGTELPADFVREIRIGVGGYRAKYGQGLGAIVDVVTRSGTDDHEFGAFGFFTADALAGDPPAGVADSRLRGFRTWDVGGSAAGPVERGRLWYSLSYNPRIDKRDIQLPGLGVHADRRVTHRFAGKLSWRPDRRTDLELSVFGDPAERDEVEGPAVGEQEPAALANPDPWLADRESGTLNVVLTARRSFGRRWFAEASVANVTGWNNVLGATERARSEPRLVDAPTGVWSGGRGARERSEWDRRSGGIDVGLIAGVHTLEAGVGYEEVWLESETATTPPGLLVHAQGPIYVVNHISGARRVGSRLPSGYLQDSWRVSDALSVDAGLRWDGQYLIGAGDSVAQSITGQLQPRLGFVARPGSRDRIFGSVGRFYQQVPLSIALLEFSGFSQAIEVYLGDPRESGATLLDRVVVAQVDRPRAAKVDDVDGENFDEIIVGYGRRITGDVWLSARVLHRELRAAFGTGIPDHGDTVVVFTGNPGRGDLDFLPEPERRYTALEITANGRLGDSLRFLASYVWSRTRGNYTGIFPSDVGVVLPNWNFALQRAEQAPNSSGRLPNDRPHVFELFGSYHMEAGLSLGASFDVMSGTPLNEFGRTYLNLWPTFLVPRGTAGRTPTVWDLNLRIGYDAARLFQFAGESRLILDVLHVGSPRRPVRFGQFRHASAVAEPPPDPTFGVELAHQPPMQVRLGLRLAF